MTRRLLNFLTALSLLLCVAVVALWIRSRAVGDHLEHKHFRHDGRPGMPGRHHMEWVAWYVSTRSGELTVAHLTLRMTGRRQPEQYARAGQGWKWTRRPPRKADPHEDSPLRWIGVSVIRQDPVPSGDTYCSVTVPLWLLATASAALPAARALRRLRRLSRSGLCPQCGYDLRATPLRCPECGVAASVTPLP